MADFQGGEWLESQLARQLGPVAAPDSLWLRIHEQRRPLRVQANPLPSWLLAAAVLLLLGAGLAWRLGATNESLQMLANRELREMGTGSGPLDIRSGDPGEIESWVKAKLNYDVRLADHSGPSDQTLQIVGARMVRTGTSPAVLIVYRAGQGSAAMIVERGRPAAIAFGESRGSCLLCHAHSALLVLR